MLPQSPGQAAWHSLRNRKAPWNSGPCSVLASQQTWGNQQVQWQKLHHGVSPTLSACSKAFPLILVLLVIPQRVFQKQPPKKVYLHLGPKWFQSPTTWLGVPCVLPSIAGVSVGKDWWYPVLTLYLWVAVLNSLFLGNTKNRWAVWVF